MDGIDAVQAFHDQGGMSGPLLPVYHFNALCMSRLLPEGGTVFDLGCGSGRYLAYLARCRPDIRAIGIDLSSTMLELGRRFLREEELSDRVELREGDMTDFAAMAPADTDIVSCVYALHHLPAMSDAVVCLAQARGVCDQTGSGFWLFDFVRPRHPRTPLVFPEVLTPEAPEAFRIDSRHSLVAAFTFEEVRRACLEAGFEGMRSGRSRLARFYQAHWLPRRGIGPKTTDALWEGRNLPSWAEPQFAGLRRLFGASPISTDTP